MVKQILGNLPLKIFIGMMLGIFCGLFFGEMCAPLAPIGEAYYMLLRMSVLPYIAFALMHGIGRLTVDEAKNLLKKGWPFFFLIWGLSIAVIYSLKFLLPEADNVLYQRGSLSIKQSSYDFLEMFIPTNFFKALANDSVPAVVVFCLIFGAALVKSSSKSTLIHSLETIVEALNEMTTWISRLGPYGAFALMASSLGTIAISELAQLQFYLIAVIIGSLFLAFWVFPIAIATFTEVRYRDIYKELPTMFLLSFTAANPLVAFPFLVQAVKNISTKYLIPDKEAQKTCEAVVPIALNFPTAGNLFAILFMIFLAFFYGQTYTLGEYLKLTSLGFVLLFGPPGQMGSAVTFLIDLLQLPAHGQTLYGNAGPIIRYFLALVSIAGVAALTILVIFNYNGRLKFRPRLCARHLALSALILAGSLWSVRHLEIKQQAIMPSFAHLKLTPSVNYSIKLAAELSEGLPSREIGVEDALMRIKKTKVIRVGYNHNSMPFAYFNAQNQLVGFDIALAFQLAQALNAELEFIPFEWEHLAENLQHDLFDIAMSGVLITEARLRELALSRPYSQGKFVLVVSEVRRHSYNNYSNIRQKKNLKIAALKGTAFPQHVKKLFPEAEVIEVDSPEDFTKNNQLDAFCWTQEEAQPWTLYHPQYCTISPSPGLGKTNYTYAMSTHSPKLRAFVNQWLLLRNDDNFIPEQKSYWFSGQKTKNKTRWSIIKDVLHWVE